MPKLRSRFRALVLALALVGGAAAVPLAGQTAGPDDAVVKERLAFLNYSLSDAQPRASLWYFGFAIGYSAATVAQEALAASHWKDTRLEGDRIVRDRAFAEDMMVGGFTTGLGAASFWLSPFRAATAGRTLRRMPEFTADDRRAKLRRAEALLSEAARQEKAGRGLVTHLLNLAVNAAAGIVTCVAFDRPASDGLTTFAVGEAVSLLSILTQPTRAIRDWKAYQERFMNKSSTSTITSTSPSTSTSLETRVQDY